MAKKLKYSPKKNQPGLFDMTGDLFSQPSQPADKLEEDIHEKMTDFVVNVARQKEEEKRREEEAEIARSIELDRSRMDLSEGLLFISFGSGSSGNCSYVGSRRQGVLIDAGVDPDRIRQAMEANGLSMDCIKGICLTHDHGDHVRYVYSLVRRRQDVGIYCTPKTLNGMLRRHSLSRRIKDFHRPIYKEFPFKVAGLELTAFEVSHDGTDNSGYFITMGDRRFVIATDLGSITDRVEYYMRQARFIVIESNYDAEMLRIGPYPMYLKSRIAAGNGHLDNAVTAEFLSRIYTPELKNVFLCHLSQENNTPEAARQTVSEALLAAGVPSIGDGSGAIEMRDRALQLYVLPRMTSSLLFALR